ncbi:Uncharacterised protein [Serratia marcescens]|nr:hypothetical protein SMKC073_06080 [Serratia marcescens]BEN81784.1 hypothetical protein SMKC103_06080 [Serratia marcescens]CVF83660.1 Uncharacterised protein [Serratia marcescens]
MGLGLNVLSALSVVVNAQADALLRYSVLNCYLKD